MNVYTMPGVAEMGMVWMGSGQGGPEMSMGLMTNDNGDVMLDHDSPYFTPSHNSASNQSMDDVSQVHNSPMMRTPTGWAIDNMDQLLPYGEMKQESSDGSYMDDENSPPVYMITTSTQTQGTLTRKIKPIKHPGLVLKTPIAYQSNTDPSVIPIHKDGIAVCEKCGAIGVKHAFYTRERRFCSMACARGYNGLIPELLPQSNTPPMPEMKRYIEHKFKMDIDDDFGGLISDQPLPQLALPLIPPAPPIPPPPPLDEPAPPPLNRRKTSEITNSYDWNAHLGDVNFVAAPVTCFKHAPIVDIWGNIMVGMKVEVENTDCDNASETFPDSFWVATVMKIVGYKAQLRYEGFGLNESKDFWVSLCSPQVHPVGWCATRGKPLIPPKTIEDKYSDWKDFLCKRLTGARTLPSNFSNKITDSFKSRFLCGLNLEVVDKNRISQVKVAVVHKISGKRLNVKYYDMPPDDAGFWCHEDSPLLHPVGWARRVGHHLVAPVEYLERVNEGIWDEEDATDGLFNPIQVGTRQCAGELGFTVGMKLEAIDPLNLSSICVATVMEVLRCGYIMIRIDTYDSDMTGGDWFCYHASSPCIFPAGFCKKNGIALVPPKGYDPLTFSWPDYLIESRNTPVPPNSFNNFVPQHGFREGMKMEAADLMDPRLVCVATIARTAGRLLRVHFDGWEEEYDQWLDCESSDIYPVGWCHSIGYKLEGPPAPIPAKMQSVSRSPKGVKKRGRKRRAKETTAKPSLVRPLKTDRPPSRTFHEPSPSPSPVTSVKDEHQETLDDEGDELQEPETGQEPSGPEQSMPIASAPQSPHVQKATSYNSHPAVSPKLIPRLIDNNGGGGGVSESGVLCPNDWDVFDVAQFLLVNDCANYCDAFSNQRVDGRTLLNLTKEKIIEYTGGKVGPSVKIYDLIQQLKIKVNPAQSRLMKSNIKKVL